MGKMDIAKLVKSQSGMAERIEKAILNYSKFEKDKKTKNFIETYLEQIQSNFSKFQTNHYTIYENADKNADEYLKGILYDAVETMYIDFVAGCKDELEKLTPTAAPSPVDRSFLPTISQIVKADVKLPPISIPKFDGNYQNWRSFSDLFTSMIHLDKNLSAVQRLHYLKSCVTGEAERLLRSFETNSVNYEKAWNTLEKRYNNKRMLVQTYLQKLTNQPTIKNESHQALKTLVDQTEELLHELKTVQVITTNWDPILIHLLAQKLPNETLYLWERELGGTTDVPTYAKFKTFLEARFRTLEAIQTAQTQYSRHSNANSSSVNKNTHSFLNQTQRCIKCKANHLLHACTAFKNLTTHQKIEFVKQHKLCKNCLSPKHNSNTCTSKHNCFKCHQRHHTLLHIESNQPYSKSNSQDTINQEQTTSSDKNTTNNFLNYMSPRVLLATALVRAHDSHGNSTTLRALIDSGSQLSFITKSACKRLKLKHSKADIQVTGLGKTNTARVHKQTQLKIQSLNTDYQTNLNALIIKQITDYTPTKEIAVKNISYLNQITLADPEFAKPAPIDLLLGAEVYSSIIETGLIKGNDDTPSAQATQLGWILMGPTADKQKDQSMTSLFTTYSESDLKQLDETLRGFWEIEDIPKRPPLSPEDELCEHIYKSTVTRNVDGRYEVSLPFKSNQKPDLGKSKHKAIKQFLQLEQRFAKSPEFFELYKQCINEYLELGHMREVNTDNSDQLNVQHYYLPHHAVMKESTTTKLRVVFNASSKTSNGRSLNEQLLKGPTIQPTLWCTLLKWRMYKYALNADIEKMYRMIKIKEGQQDYQRIIWRNSPNEALKEYALTTVTFGTTPAPFLAIRTLYQLAEDEEQNFPLAASCIRSHSYVDDVLCGADSLPQALELQTQLIQMLHKGGFNLRKWAANNIKLLQNIPLESREIKTELEISETESIKTLGIKWFPSSDEFTFSVKLSPIKEIYTKRTILSEVASLFDPLGWLAPIIIVAKILIQKLWLLGCEWDVKVSDQLQEEWVNFRNELKSIENIRIPRWINTSETAHIEIHGFCDASNHAYAAVIYLKVIPKDKHSKSIVSLLLSKTRVAPTKPVTLPRLELCGALLLSRLINQLQTDLKLNVPTYAWTDSLITLSWIRGQPARWKTYVANRVSEIQDNTPPSIWRYVSGDQNPADCASRGISPTQLCSHNLWWTGPKWLSEPQEIWPIQPKIAHTELEERKIKVFLTQEEPTFLTKFSSFQKLRRITAYCLRFINKCRRLTHYYPSYLLLDELKQAEVLILKLVQFSAYAKEINHLRHNQPIHSKSHIVNLNPFLDKNSLLRVGGRIQKANIPYNSKHPIILPKNHFTSKLIIDEIHKSTLHGGNQVVLNNLRTRYWLPGAKNTIRHRLHKCIRCFKHKPKPVEQIMGNLPDCRTNIALPFSHSGVDFAGPLYYKASKLRNAKMLKCYICLFVCMATKAIHLEIVTDLTASGFIAAFKRFISRRGSCTNLYSDCGTNFIGAKRILDKELQTVLKECNKDIINELSNQNVNWHFNPPAAPHFGGLWEAGVKSVKQHMSKVLNNAHLTLEELHTLLCQIEACINSRPLTPLTADPNDLDCLTPGHFLTGRHITSVPEHQLMDKETPIRRWQFVQQLVQHFWQRWSSEYLHTLQQRTRWHKKSDNIEVNDIVLLKDERYPPTKWPLGRVIEVHPGPDNQVRVVTIKTANSTFRRPISKICKLPIENEKKTSV